MEEKLLKRDPLDEIKEAFKLIANEKTSAITFRDLKRAADKVGADIPDRELKSMIQEFDTKGEGKSKTDVMSKNFRLIFFSFSFFSRRRRFHQSRHGELFLRPSRLTIFKKNVWKKLRLGTSQQKYRFRREASFASDSRKLGKISKNRYRNGRNWNIDHR